MFATPKLASISSARACASHSPLKSQLSRPSKWVGSHDCTGAPVGGGESLNSPNGCIVGGVSYRRVAEGNAREEGTWDQSVSAALTEEVEKKTAFR